MESQQILQKKVGLYWERATLLAIIAFLFQVAPHQLGLVFMIVAVGNLFRIGRVSHNTDRTAVAKGVFYAVWIACLVLAFGFKFRLIDLAVAGIALVLLADGIMLVAERMHKLDRLFNGAWLALFLYMLIQLLLDPNWLSKAL